MIKDLGRKILLLDEYKIKDVYYIKQYDDIRISFSLYKNSLPFNCTGQNLTLNIKKPN